MSCFGFTNKYLSVSGRAITEYPAVIGNDSAGVVEEIGEGVTGFVKGDEV